MFTTVTFVKPDLAKTLEASRVVYIGIEFLTNLHGWAIWKQTSYNNNIRKNFAGIGFTYDEDRDAFIPPHEFASWTLNESTCNWEAPIAKPTDGNIWEWDEETLQWIRVNE